MCNINCKVCRGILILALGIFFLIKDVLGLQLGNISDWTIVLIVLGLGILIATQCCKDSCCVEAPKKKGRK